MKISQVYVSRTTVVSTKPLTTEPFNPSKKESDTQVPLLFSFEISNLTSFNCSDTTTIIWFESNEKKLLQYNTVLFPCCYCCCAVTILTLKCRESAWKSLIPSLKDTQSAVVKCALTASAPSLIIFCRVILFTKTNPSPSDENADVDKFWQLSLVKYRIHEKTFLGLYHIFNFFSKVNLLMGGQKVESACLFYPLSAASLVFCRLEKKSPPDVKLGPRPPAWNVANIWAS